MEKQIIKNNLQFEKTWIFMSKNKYDISNKIYKFQLTAISNIINPTQMSTILTPSKSSHSFKRYSSTSYLNRELHSSIKKTNTFSLLVNQHLVKSRQENYALKTVTRSYSENRIFRIYSSRNSFKKTPKNSANQYKKQIQVPEEQQMVDALNKKAGAIPDIRQKFEQEMYGKLMLKQKMLELKSKIYEERKIKDKVLLRNCKLANEHEKSCKNNQILKEQSKQNLTLICILASECSQLDLQLDEAQKMNKKITKKIEEEYWKVAELKEQIQNTKIVFDQKTNQVAQLKQIQMILYKKMTNMYMQMNLLKQQKALLLNNILSDVQSHS